jgi:hypothetical protein
VSGMWQPIETAPKDGTRVLIYVPYDDGDGEVYLASFGYDVGYGNGPSWQPEYAEVAMFNSPDDRQPTHWMPLPDPPAE